MNSDLKQEINLLKKENRLLNNKLMIQESKIQELINHSSRFIPNKPETSTKAILTDFCQIFTGHGFNKLTSKRSATRFVWLTSIIVATIACIYYIVTSFTDYYAYEVISNSRTFYRKEMIFPAFTICVWYQEYPILDSIIHCQFNRRNCKDMLEFQTIIVVGSGSSDRRSCIRFNGKKNGEQPLSVSKSGSYNGLVVIFNLPTSKYPVSVLGFYILKSSKTSNITFNKFYNSKIKIQLFYGIFDNAIPIISTYLNNEAILGKHYKLELKKVVTNKLDMPFNECVDNIEGIKGRKYSNRDFEYHQDYCHRLCLLHNIESECACDLIFQLESEGNDTCDIECVDKVKNTFDYEKFCNKDCPTECDSVIFEYETILRNLEDHPLVLNLIASAMNVSSNEMNKTDLINISKSTVSFEINYLTLGFVENLEIPKKTWTNLIAELGGIIGINN